MEVLEERVNAEPPDALLKRHSENEEAVRAYWAEVRDEYLARFPDPKLPEYLPIFIERSVEGRLKKEYG